MRIRLAVVKPTARKLHKSLTVPLAALVLVACEAASPGDPATDPVEQEQEPDADAALATAVETLTALDPVHDHWGDPAIRYHAEGIIDPPNEGPYPGADGPSFPHTEFAIDVVQELNGGRLRIDRTGTNPGPGFVVDQIERIDGDVGEAEGVNALGFPLGAMSSDRVAALVRNQRLLNPSLLAMDAVADPSLILGAQLGWDGEEWVVRVTLDNEVAPIALDVAVFGPPRIVRLTTYENDLLLRDSEVEIEYGAWAYVPGFGPFPHTVEVWHDGYLLRTEQRSDATGLVPLQDEEIHVPVDTLPPADLALAELGRRSSQAQLSFPPPIAFPDGRPAAVFPSELSPGVFFLGGTLHNSLLVEQQERLVLVEAPGYPERSVAIAQWAEANFDKPITHVIATHHHSDHTAGLREFVARGAAVAVGESTASFFADEVFAASSSIVPDTLSMSDDIEPEVIPVASDETWTLDDPLHPVVVVPVESQHATDMVVAYLPAEGFLFNSDLFTPDFPATNEAALLAGATELNDAIVAFDLDVTLMPSGHGFSAPTYDEFLTRFDL